MFRCITAPRRWIPHWLGRRFNGMMQRCFSDYAPSINRADYGWVKQGSIKSAPQAR